MTKKQEIIVKTAKANLGKPYKYGAKLSEAPDFFDCSSFIWYVFKQVKIELPRTCIEQAEIGKRVLQSKIKPGDILFLKGEIGRYNKKFPDGIGHAAIYAGDNNVIHATSRRLKNDLFNANKIKEIGGVQMESLNKLIKKGKLRIIRRILI